MAAAPARSPCCSPASSRSALAAGPPARDARRPVSRARRSSSPSTSRARCARPTSSPTGWPSRRRRPERSSRSSRRASGWASSSSPGSPSWRVPPTTDREALVAAIDGLTTGRGTAIGSAMLKGARRDRRGQPGRAAGGRRARDRAGPRQATKPGVDGFVPDIVVLLTDGANNRGIEPLDAVPYAVERRVRVYPIGFGTDEPVAAGRARASSSAATSSTRAASAAVAGSAAAASVAAAVRRFLVADEPTLKAVAAQTGGTYHSAKDADQLQQGVRRPPEGGRDAEEAHRGHVDARGVRRRLRCRRRRGLDALEPVPVAGPAAQR